MKFIENTNSKTLEIWVPSSDKAIFRDTQQYKDHVEEYKAKGFKICVYIGGATALLPQVVALIDRQMEPYIN